MSETKAKTKSAEVGLSVEGVSVSYNVHEYKYSTLKEFVLNAMSGRGKTQVLEALKNVSVSISKGESVAFLGHNGSGKSTLLKVIAGIILPLKGTVNASGRVAPMIELGAGFDPELSGRENVFLSCMLMGLEHHDIAQRYERIVQFAELENYMHLPLKNYSSGMQARLGFACATTVDPDILLVDEVLSVGDANFARKCLARITDLKQKGTTIVLVSHDENTVRVFCQRALVLREGNVLFDGPVAEALALHHQILDEIYLAQLNEDVRRERERKRALEGNVGSNSTGAGLRTLPRAHALATTRQESSPAGSLDVSKPFEITLSISLSNANEAIGDINIGFGVNTLDNRRLFGRNLRELGCSLPRGADFANGGERLFTFAFPRGLPFLSTGAYVLVVGVLDTNDTRSLCEFTPQEFVATNPDAPNNFDGDLIDCRKWVSVGP